MKRDISLIGLVVLMIISTANAFSQGERPGRTVLLTLQPGEQPVTSECCFALSASQNSIYLVTNLQGKNYVYDDGRERPYDKTNPLVLRSCPGSDQRECMVYMHQFDENMMQELVKVGNDGQSYISFKGTEYGPYLMVIKSYMPPDRSWFVAIVADREMKYQLVTSTGGRFPLGTMAFNLHISPSGRKVFASMKEESGPSVADFMKMDMSNMSVEELTNLAKQLEEQQKNAPPPQGFVVLRDGSRIGPFEPGEMDDDNPAFNKTAADHWVMVIGNKLYVDGTLLKDFGDFYINPCDIWLSEDGRRYAVRSYDKLVFSDGNEYAFPLKVIWEKKNGAIHLSWVSFENERDIVLYSRDL